MTPRAPDVEQRKGPRIECEHGADLLAADGSAHPITLFNLSAGGAQAGVPEWLAEALGVKDQGAVSFRLWLPGDDEDMPIEGTARVAYLEPADGQGQRRMGLAFEGLASEASRRVHDFIATFLRYAE